MEVRPGFKQTEAGVIPSDWNVKPIIDCCEYADYRGKTPPKTQSGTFLVTARNVRKGIIDYVESQEFVPSALYDQIMRRGKPLIGDVLITTEAPLGNVAQIDREDVALAQRIIKYRPKSDHLSSTYLKHYFLSDRFQQILDDHSSGSTAKGIKGRVLHQLPVVLPSPAEQLAIAAALSDVDALLGALDRLIAKKRDLKQAAMQQLLTGQTRLPGFHGDWEVKRLGHLGSTFGGLTGKTKADFGEGEARYITFMNVMSNVVIDCGTFEQVQVSLTESQNRAKKGDLFFNGSSETPEEVAMCAVLLDVVRDVYLNSFCFGFRFHDGAEADGLFMAYYLRSNEGRELMKSLAQGSTRYNLSKVALLKSPLRLPKLPEQTAIAEVLTEMDGELAVLEQRREKTRALKQGIMQELLTGKTRLISFPEES